MPKDIDLVEALASALERFGHHDSSCCLSQITAGEPREDGYYHLVRGKWYRSDSMPACECGFSDALKLWQ